MFTKTLVFISTLVVASQVCAVEKTDVKYFLYTPEHFTTPVEVSFGGTYGVDFINPSKHIKILCHGYVDNHNTSWVTPTKTAYIAMGEENVISVDWSKDANGLYSHAVNSAKPVGEFIADLILHLHLERKIPLDNFHLIGHSLGSHIAGYAGKKVFQATGHKIGRITGLDPAGPSFNGNKLEEHLNTDDATFVDAIHTDTGMLGYKKSLAHADFWPNGGSAQAGCGILEVGCSHNRAPKYFYESINSVGFQALECGSFSDYNKGKCQGNKIAIMGDNCGFNARGNFYLKTNTKSPFAMN